MKVLYIHPNADLYGASRSLLRLIGHLDNHEIEPTVVLPEHGPLASELRRLGAEVIVLRYLGVIRRRNMRSWRLVTFLLSLLPSTIVLWRLIIRRRIELVHSNTATTITPAVAAKLSGIPHVWHVREMFADEFPVLWRFYRRFIAALASEVVCVSAAVQKQFKAIPNILLLPNGVELSEFNLSREEVTKRRLKYLGNQEDACLVGMASRISAWKGQDVFVRACRLLRDRPQYVVYLMIGDAFEGNEYLLDELREYVQSNGLRDQVIFKGFVPDPRGLIGALDVLVLPSITPDPFPGVVLEAMALGIAVVATNIGGPREQVLDGETGLLVPPSDPQALAEAIAHLLDNPSLRRQMGQAGRERVGRSYRLADTGDAIHALYKGLRDEIAFRSSNCRQEPERNE